MKNRIMGCDPGTALVGYGITEVTAGQLQALAWGVIRTGAREPLPRRLQELHRQVDGLLRTWRPDVLVVEELILAENPRTALAVAHARGVILLAAAQNNVPVRVYTPSEIKLAVTGYGAATKQQVQFMVRALLGLPGVPEPDDAADALALALCHAYRAAADRCPAART